MSETDTEDGCFCFLECILDVLDGNLEHGGITRAVGNE